MKFSILTMLLFFFGCARPMTGREQVLFSLMIGANVCDAYTTIEAVEVDSRGGHFHELNPILGRHPDSGNVILFKGVVVGILYGLGEIWPEHREAIYSFGAISAGAASAVNYFRDEHER